jgi:hypothetical protein
VESQVVKSQPRHQHSNLLAQRLFNSSGTISDRKTMAHSSESTRAKLNTSSSLTLLNRLMSTLPRQQTMRLPKEASYSQ